MRFYVAAGVAWAGLMAIFIYTMLLHYRALDWPFLALGTVVTAGASLLAAWGSTTAIKRGYGWSSAAALLGAFLIMCLVVWVRKLL